MKTTLLFLSVFLSVNLFGQKLKLSNDFKQNLNSTNQSSYVKEVVGKKAAVLEMYRVLRENGIDSSSVELKYRSAAPIFHQENIKSRKRIWIFSVMEHFNFQENNKFNLYVSEHANERISFGRFKERDGTMRELISKPFN